MILRAVKHFSILHGRVFVMVNCTAALTYYYDPAILRNKLTPLLIFRDLALRKRDLKNSVYFYVFYRVYTNIPNLYGLVVYSFMDFLGDSLACVRFGTKIQTDFHNQ